MDSIRRWRKAAFAVLTISVVVTGAEHARSTPPTDAQLDEAALAAVGDVQTEDLCGEAAPGEMRCFAKRVILPAGQYQPYAPQGLGPADLRAAYALPTSGGGGRTVAIVDAYDAPNAESDLATYRSQYGLPPCTTSNGCFKKVNQNGQTTGLPRSNSGWAGEIALDIDMVSAVCPDCNILLVEANSASNADLGAAVNTAARLGAVAISNSYGGGEGSSAPSDDSQYYNHPGVLITASSGDNSFSAGASFPASGAHVLAVGGTSLTRSSSARGWAEKAWRSGGSGCSGYIAKPGFQTDQGCSRRMVADVSAVGDPATGVAVYDGGWQVVGGTSASSPIVAAVFTLLNLQGSTNGFPYAHTNAFYDVTSGANGSCSTPYFCTAGAGYDGPTGIGTPNGAVLATLSGSPPPPPPVDSGAPPPPQDSGTPVTPDSGSAGGDSGLPVGVADGGGQPDAHVPGADASPHPGVEAGAHDDAGGNADEPFTASSPSGCACSAPSSDEAPDAGAASLLVLGAAALVRRRRR